MSESEGGFRGIPVEAADWAMNSPTPELYWSLEGMDEKGCTDLLAKLESRTEIPVVKAVYDRIAAGHATGIIATRGLPANACIYLYWMVRCGAMITSEEMEMLACNGRNTNAQELFGMRLADFPEAEELGFSMPTIKGNSQYIW